MIASAAAAPAVEAYGAACAGKTASRCPGPFSAAENGGVVGGFAGASGSRGLSGGSGGGGGDHEKTSKYQIKKVRNIKLNHAISQKNVAIYIITKLISNLNLKFSNFMNLESRIKSSQDVLRIRISNMNLNATKTGI